MRAMFGILFNLILFSNAELEETCARNFTSNDETRNLSFYNNRWTSLTDVLKNNGWVEAKDGMADLAYWLDKTRTQERKTKHPGRVSLFSRFFTDFLSFKRSVQIGLKNDPLHYSYVPPTYVDYDKWKVAFTKEKESAISKGLSPPTWFVKDTNVNNQKGVKTIRDINDAEKVLGKYDLEGVIDREPVFYEVMVKNFGEANVAQVYGDYIHSEENITEGMKRFVIQKGVPNPLLIEGRKFFLRMYVYAVIRPENCVSNSKLSELSPRTTEIYLSAHGIAAPNSDIYIPQSNDESTYKASHTRIRMQDGNPFEKGRWDTKHFPRIKDIIQRVATKGGFHLTNAASLQQSKRYNYGTPKWIHFFGDDPPESMENLSQRNRGRFSVFGVDFIIDENDRPWLIDINGNCNLRHVPSTKELHDDLAQAVYDVIINPIFRGTEPHSESTMIVRVV